MPDPMSYPTIYTLSKSLNIYSCSVLRTSQRGWMVCVNEYQTYSSLLDENHSRSSLAHTHFVVLPDPSLPPFPPHFAQTSSPPHFATILQAALSLTPPIAFKRKSGTDLPLPMLTSAPGTSPGCLRTSQLWCDGLRGGNEWKAIDGGHVTIEYQSLMFGKE